MITVDNLKSAVLGVFITWISAKIGKPGLFNLFSEIKVARSPVVVREHGRFTELQVISVLLRLAVCILKLTLGLGCKASERKKNLIHLEVH